MTIFVELDSKNKSTGTTTTHYLMEQERLNRDLTSAWSWEHSPIVKAFELASSFRQNIISRVSGVLTLDIEPSTFGYQSRIIDILQEDDIINQRVEIISTFIGKVDSYNIDYKRNELKISCSLDLYNDNTLNHVLRRSDWSDLRGNAGKVPCPVAFGENQFITPVSVDITTGTKHSTSTNKYIYAYNSIFMRTGAASFNSTGVNNYYVQDHDGKFKEFISATDFTTEYFGKDLDGSETTTFTRVAGVSSGYDILYARKFTPQTDNENIIAYSGFINTKDVGTYNVGGVLSGKFIMQICKVDQDKPGQVLANAERDFFDYTWDSSGNNKIELIFDKLVPLVDDELYLVYGFTYKNSSTTVTKDLPKIYEDTGTTDTILRKNSSYLEWESSTSQNTHYVGVYGISLTDNPSGTSANIDDYQTHFSHVDIHVPQTYDSITVYPTPSALRFQFNIDGIEDDSSGTITGTSNELLEQPDHIASLILATRDSSNYWIPRDINTTRFSASNAILSNSTHEFYRKIAGSVHNFTTISSLIANIARETATFFYIDADYSGDPDPVIYTWGAQVTPSETFTDLNSRLDGLFSTDLSGVVNKAEFTYSRNFTDIETDVFLFELEQYDQYENSVIDGYDLTSDNISGRSHDNYGERINKKEQIDFLGDSTSVNSFLQYVLRTHDVPALYCRVVRPEIEPSVNIMETVNLVFPQLPATYGTSGRLFNSEEGTAQTYAPDTAVRAQRYIGQVYGIRSKYKTGETIETEYLIRLLIHDFEPTK